MAPPRKKKSRQPAPTTILALGDDLLREVFLRLPSLPSLVRAALACPAFLRAVRSSPAFRRRFRDLHSPTILGAFLVDDDTPMSTFAPLRLRDRRSDPDHAAALRGLDAFLTRLPDAIGVKKHDGEDAQDEDEEDVEDEDGPVAEWSMSACCDGYVLLVTPQWNTKKVAVYDPLTGAVHLFPGPPDEVFGGQSGYTAAEFHVIPSEADDRSFRVLCVPKKHWGKQIAVLSLDTREWQIATTAWSLRDAGNVELVRNGLVYWACSGRQDYIPVLDTATMQFSQIDVPTRFSASLGETNDGKLCLVRASDHLIDVWVQRAGDDGVDKWMRNRTFHMVDVIGALALNIMVECPSLNVVAIRGGIVYLTIHQYEPPSWLLSFCIETYELQKLCQITRSEFYYPCLCGTVDEHPYLNVIGTRSTNTATSSLAYYKKTSDMASRQPPLPPPPLKKKSPPATPTTISDLGDDLLREVFVHLPSLLSLVRAALTCPAFLRAVRSSPAFRRRFRELHPPPLLGVFLDIHDPSIPVFAPIRRHSDRDHAAAIRSADVFFTLLPEDDNDPDPQWSMEYCHDGFVVLVIWEIKKMAVYDPLTRSLDLFPVPPDEICCDMYVEFHMLASEENHRPFHVVSLSRKKGGAKPPSSHQTPESGRFSHFRRMDVAL
ncbi:hypothetical protein ACQ4PT_033913 [Festuca glaucescens]